jgi:murein DD-endopeptidase MepM/ murein hydrolase activator NlpD
MPVHQRRVIAVRPGTIAVVALLLALLAAWAALTVWYFLARDEVTASLVARQREIELAYRDNIEALRARLEQATSQKLLQENAFETRVAELLQRQARLETRHAMLTTLWERPAVAETSSLPAEAQSPSVGASQPLAGAAAYAPEAPKPAPVLDHLELRLRGSGAELRPPPRRAIPADWAGLPLDGRIAALQRSASALEKSQVQALETLLRATQGQIARMRLAIREAGVDPDKLQAPAGAAIGGPFVPLEIDPKSGPFEAMVHRVQGSLMQREALRVSTTALPVGTPLAGDAEVTSGFGFRLDPFTRRPAMHTGLDFRGDYGTPVRATGAGRVISAEHVGGYGRMVEVDHGSGVTTRYAHLASMQVVPGQTVEAGAVLGRIGSSGRSTGAHLHYETRLDGEPVNPQRFLTVGTRLVMAQQAVPVISHR